MEYCPGGGVIDLMNRRLQQRLTEPEILKIFSDVAEALAYLHYCNPPVLHRDLKIENILILNDHHYKLCDFGSASLSKGNYIPTTIKDIQKIEEDIQRHTTLQYRAPEMIDIYQKRPINEKADIWAMGVLLYKLCYYTTPFEEEGQLAILNARYTIPNTPIFTEGLRHLIISMLQEDQNLRPNIYQVLRTVCHLRGVECPIRDIYTEPIITPPFGKQTSSSSSSSMSPVTNSSIFEKMPSPAQEVPNIKPMRRGRPTSTKEQNSSTFDPFDPNNHTSSTPSPVQSTATTLPESFQNSFTSFNKQTSSPPSRVHSAPLSNNDNPNPSPKPMKKKATTATANANATTAKVIHTQPVKPVLNMQEEKIKEKEEVKEPRPTVSTNKIINKKSVNDNDKDDDSIMPKINKNVSSSIEARFMAIKNATRNNNTPPIVNKKTKPAPPPKPARFRSTQKANNNHEPSVDDFENKFPSLEELDKFIS
ncbi:kinase-like domain-containing protein [Cokeromyces recurvatus]|uniref:kinase-like domain-containing protein n=1 Tax=Cokeromyces recurvatus TaxID=90255 RepID=UPI0022206BCF|nr:kinase-like domain-containing protein [Cokeromyces recurvatus]KAI7898850.1 kinase-like domain-containing protein [Cokeromyces recurvatus]